MRNEWIFVCVVTLLVIAAVVYPTCMQEKQNSVVVISIELRNKILHNKYAGLVKENQAILMQILKDNNIALKPDEMYELNLSNWKLTIRKLLKDTLSVPKEVQNE